jgi:hypothetical protein
MPCRLHHLNLWWPSGSFEPSYLAGRYVAIAISMEPINLEEDASCPDWRWGIPVTILDLMKDGCRNQGTKYQNDLDRIIRR